MKQTHVKGETILETQNIALIPLFVETDDVLQKQLPHGLPQFPIRWHCAADNVSWNSMPPAALEYRKTLLHSMDEPQSSTCTIAIVVVALHMVFDPAEKACQFVARHTGCTDNDDTKLDTQDNFDLAIQTWEKLKVHIKINLQTWINLVGAVANHLALVSTVHPVYRYAEHVMPRLSPTHLTQAAKILGLGDQYSSQSVLRYMKDAQDKAPPRNWAVLLLDQEMSHAMVQDCFPKAELLVHCEENGKNNTLALVATYPSMSLDSSQLAPHQQQQHLATPRPPTPLGVDRLQLRSFALEERVRKFRSALQPSCCLCDRCRYEMMEEEDAANPRGLLPLFSSSYWVHSINKDRILQLAHGFMEVGDWNRAKKLYKAIVGSQSSATTSSDISTQQVPLNAQMDAWHALGAIELSTGHFVAAQRIWNEARKSIFLHHSDGKKHNGLELQWIKLESYKYLDLIGRLPKHGMTRMLPKSIEITSGAFVSPVLDSKVCNQIFEWAKLGTWTKQRHYAVPTRDVPVHTVAPLLEWFNIFMEQTMRPLLAHQFGTSLNYYVHDAFVVKYTAGEPSNHLPIHTDESTHSFVIALNDDYQGGGTYFYDTKQNVKLHIGDILSFRGDSVLHGGEALQSGERRIVAVFLYLDNDDEKRGDCSLPSRRDPIVSKKRSSPGEKENSSRKGGKSSFSFDFAIS